MSLLTPWGEALDADAPLPEHPRPQLVREAWASLNGRWSYAIVPTPGDGPGAVPGAWDGQIVVPFSPEAPLSGVRRTVGPGDVLWYRRTLTPPATGDGDRVLLHLGAVDQRCWVYLDGALVGEHIGGYLPFTVDLTDRLAAATTAELVVAVRDDTDASWHARGKQSSRRGGIWYTPHSGIWQTVWLETVPATYVSDLVLVPQLEAGAVDVTVLASGPAAGPAAVEIRADGAVVGTAHVTPGTTTRLPLADVRPWSPEDPFLYGVTVRLGTDVVTSYVGLRSVALAPDARGAPRLLLNGAPYPHIGVLDQGYWPDGLCTPPSDEAMVADITAMKDLGFTMLRKHIKIEPLRWYYHCDRLGMLVWQDMVNGGRRYRPEIVTAPVALPVRLRDDRYRLFARADAAGRAEFREETRRTVELLRSSPSVVAWVPFNEGWGQFDAADVAADVRRLDPTRLIDHASGWHDQGAGDLDSRHVYFRPVRLRPRDAHRALALTEYGGYSHAVPGHTWGDDEFGYRRYTSSAELTAAFARLHTDEVLPAVRAGVAATVYTQLSDVEDEVNGLLSYDRKVLKMDAATVREVNAALRAAGTTPAAGEPVRVVEREITAPVDLCRPDGSLNPDAVGWTRHPLHRTDQLGALARGWGRTKRWEYWGVMTPTHVLAQTVATLDFAALLDVWLLDRRTGRTVSHGAVRPLSAGVTLPGTLGAGPVRARAGDLAIAVDELDGGTRLRVVAPGLRWDVVAAQPAGREGLGVVVPWDARRFQYTVKDIGRPAEGRLWVDDAPAEPVAGWAALDHGRGRWPRTIRWNWGAAAGRSDGHDVALQLGAKWTDGTGSTENAVVVDGHLSKISEELVWEYDDHDWMRPWRMRGESLDVTFTPFHLKASRTDFKVIVQDGHQCFGTYSGWVRDDAGRRVVVDGLEGWAEDVYNRW